MIGNQDIISRNVDDYQYLKGNSLYPGMFDCIYFVVYSFLIQFYFLRDESNEINPYYLTSEKTDQTAKSCAKQIKI